MPKTTKEVNKKKSENLKSKSTSNSKKTSSNKTVSQNAKVATKSTTKTSTKKVSTSKTKNTVSKKTNSNKKTPSKKAVSKTNKKTSINILEYYDLPYRYNETIVKILAQTPKTLFVYWDISDADRETYIKQYGKDFFDKTKPVLIIHNKTMNYTFEIEINDFANCWYFNINDEKCEYSVELGRKPKEINNAIQIPNNYLYITSSNKIESPNGHILFEKEQNVVFYKDVKTNQTFSKDITKIDFIKYLGKVYKMQEVYKKIYKDEDLSNIVNPSSDFN